MELGVGDASQENVSSDPSIDDELAAHSRPRKHYQCCCSTRADKGHRLKLGDTHPHTLQSLDNLIDLYEAWNKPEEAKEWRAKLALIEDFAE